VAILAALDESLEILGAFLRRPTRPSGRLWPPLAALQTRAKKIFWPPWKPIAFYGSLRVPRAAPPIRIDRAPAVGIQSATSM